MRFTCKNKALLFSVLAMGGCSSLPDDEGGMFGRPTPGLLVYASQVTFAHSRCQQGFSEKASDRFYKSGVELALQLSHYRETVPSFSSDMDILNARYSDKWAVMSDAERGLFCSGYQADVAWAEDTWLLPMIGVGDRFRIYFSPLSKARIERAQKISLLSGVLSVGFAAAGVNQAKQGDFATAQQFNTYGRTLSDSTPVVSNGHDLPCNAYRPFVDANSRIDDTVFSNYYSLRTCR